MLLTTRVREQLCAAGAAWHGGRVRAVVLISTSVVRHQPMLRMRPARNRPPCYSPAGAHKLKSLMKREAGGAQEWLVKRIRFAHVRNVLPRRIPSTGRE